MGAVVYQVLVDRYAPSADLEGKKRLYAEPKTLHAWSEVPRRGTFLEKQQLWSQEVAFWGGDLASLQTRLDHVQQLGADVLYLNPIHLGWTNHKYDSLDFNVVSPEFGTREDVKRLAAELHRRGMKLVLDGVFNHMGRQSQRFQDARAGRAGDAVNGFALVIFVALPIRHIQRVMQLMDDLRDTTASIYYVPDIFVFDLIQARFDEIDGMPVVAVCETPYSGVNALLKRWFDIVVTVMGLLVVWPILLFAAIGGVNLDRAPWRSLDTPNLPAIGLYERTLRQAAAHRGQFGRLMMDGAVISLVPEAAALDEWTAQWAVDNLPDPDVVIYLPAARDRIETEKLLAQLDLVHRCTLPDTPFVVASRSGTSLCP